VSPPRSEELPVFQNAGFQPPPYQVDQARISDSVFDKAEQPSVIKAPEEVLQIRLVKFFN
jgi:hypothetical protein